MSRKWWTVIITIAVIIGVFTAIKLMPLWAIIIAIGSFAFGAFSGYILKKKDIVEKIIEKPVEVIKTITKEVPVEVEKIIYREPTKEAVESDSVKVEQPKIGKRNRNKKVVK